MTPSQRLFAALLPLILLVGCATYEYHEDVLVGPRAPQFLSPDIPSEQGRVWFYRNTPRTTSGAWPHVLLDGKKVAEANPNKVFYLDISPGTYDVYINTNENFKVPITVEKQQHVFIETKVSEKGMYPTVVDPRTGRRELGLITCEVAKKVNPDEPKCK